MTINLSLDDTNLMVNYTDTNGDIWQDSIHLSDLRQVLNIKPPVDEIYEAYKEWWIEEMAPDIETLSEFSTGENT